MRASYGLGLAALFTLGLVAAPRIATSEPAPTGKLKLCSDLKFSKCGTNVSANQDIFIRVEFAVPVAKAFKDAMGPDWDRSTGQWALAVAKNIDDENPIVISNGTLMVSRYGEQKTLDLTLQASAATLEKLAEGGDEVAKAIPFNSITTMGNGGISMLWSQKAMRFADGKSDWELFVMFVPMEGDAGAPKLVAQTKFSYTIDKDSRKKLGAGSLEKDKFATVQDDGINTGVHKENVEKIVFGPKKMLKDFDDKGALTPTVKALAGGLYARVYMKASAKNILASHGLGAGVGEGDTWTQLTMTVDGKLSRTIDDHLRGDEALKFTSFSLTLVPANEEDAKDMPQHTRKFVFLMSTLTPGKHKVALRYVFKNIGGEDIVFATGEFEVNINAKDRDTVAKKWGLQLSARGLLDTEKGLEKELKALWPKIPVLRAPWGWKVFDQGGKVWRTALVIGAWKGKDGLCTQSVSLIRQDKTGAGFGKAYLPGEVPQQSEDGDLPCQNLPKK